MIFKPDIAIAGGGMVGLAMAASLADAGLKVVVIEKSDLEELNICSNQLKRGETQLMDSDYDIRVSAISPANQCFLKTLGAWQLIPENKRADYDQMYVWDAEGQGTITFDAAEVGSGNLGAIVENQVLRSALYQSLMQNTDVRFISNTEIEQITPLENHIEIILANHQVFKPRLLIGADGAFSSIREKSGISHSEVPYRQQAFVANVKTEYPHDNCARQRFTPNGPVAFLPLPQPHLSSVVWSVDDHKAKQLSGLSREAFAAQLARVFEYRLGEVSLVSEYRAFPLLKRHADTYLSCRCALIGDAAHTIHPLAGQGVNLGFQDVACLAKRIQTLVNKGRDYGMQSNLRCFERERKAANYTMQYAMSGFKSLFGQDSMWSVLSRNTGMNFLDKSDFLKRMVIQRAMGF